MFNVGELKDLQTLRAITGACVGFCDWDKSTKMIRTIIDRDLKTTCEIGVYGGKSYFPQVFAHKHRGYGLAIAIDPWTVEDAIQEGPELAHINPATRNIDFEGVYQTMMGHIKTNELEQYCKIIRKPSFVAHAEIGTIDFLHIDGNHGLEIVKQDFDLFFPKISSGGIIWFDDAQCPTIVPVINMANDKMILIERVNNQAVFEKR